MVARTICSRRNGATLTFGLTIVSSWFFGWSTNYHREGRTRQAGRAGTTGQAAAGRSGGGGAHSRAAAALGGSLRLQALERHPRVIGERHRGRNGAGAGPLGNEAMDRPSDGPVGRR